MSRLRETGSRRPGRAKRSMFTKNQKFLNRGTYETVLIESTAQTWTNGTEVEINTAGSLVASSVDRVFPWIRVEGYIQSAATNMPFELAMFKIDSGDADPDLNDSSAMEELKRDGVLFFKKMYFAQKGSLGPPPHIELEFRNVHLPKGMELRTIVRPWETSGADLFVKLREEYSWINA